MKQYGLMSSKTPGLKHAMIGDPGRIDSWIQVVSGPGSLLTNPAVLAGGAGLVAQFAMQQSMDEITDYLARIDEKLDDVLRSQTNQVLARVDGVELAVKEAESVKGATGRISDITWSKVQGSSTAILETQGYALRQLKYLADKLDEKAKFGDLVDVMKDAETDVQKWLAVLGRCFQLHDAVAVIELDRVLDDSPEELDRHRIGLKRAREDRLELIAQTTRVLLDRMNAAASSANRRVLLNPRESPAVVRASNEVASEVHDFNELLGIESGLESSETRKWRDAAEERLDQARHVGSEGVDRAKQLGSQAGERAKALKGKLAGRLGRKRGSAADE